MERRRISRPVAYRCALPVVCPGCFVFCVRVVPLFLDDLEELVRQLPAYAADLQRFLHRLEEGYRRFNLPPNAGGSSKIISRLSALPSSLGWSTFTIIFFPFSTARLSCCWFRC